ncbi:MAG: sugar phosphate isomerase/epimerase [Clostridia bacterium]|nr:sugar phosphate isomerase/epimerase [Clostridia bacterium]
MFSFPIGVMVDSFRCEMHDAIRRSAEIGAQGLQMYATRGAYSPEQLTPAARRELLDFVKSNGLVFSALCGDLGKGFTNPELNPGLIETSKRILDLAKELETDVVTTHIGVVPDDPTCERYAIMQEACAELAAYADSVGAHFAIETGPEPAAVLRNFLDSLGSRGVAVNLDPANFVMVTGDDPVQAVYTLRDYIVHTHAKDGVKLRDCNVEALYAGIEDEIKEGKAFAELPLGKGGVDFDRYLAALEEIGYRGFLTIECEVGDDPAKDIAEAVCFLNEKIKTL